MRAKVVEAEAEIPLAIAKALQTGNIGVMDYYNMENIKSDTEMRESLSNIESKNNSNSSDEISD